MIELERQSSGAQGKEEQGWGGSGGEGEGGKLQLFSAKLCLLPANSETYTQFSLGNK